MAEHARRLGAALVLVLAAVGTAARAADAAPPPAMASSAAPAPTPGLAPAPVPATSAGPGAPAAVPTSPDPVLEARMLAITSELRCLVCQNQTIADSHADLAADLRQQVREMLQQGRSPDEILRYMTDRYGDFILYRPPLKPATLLLWGGPALLLAIAIGALARVIVRRSRLGDDRFEPDPAWEDDADGAAPEPRTGNAA